MVSPEIFPLPARQALQQKRQASCTSASSEIEIFERRLRSFLVEEKGQVLVRSVTLDVLHIARTLRFAAAIGVRAGEMSPEELHSKRLALDRLLRCAETDLRELQVLLWQHSADLIGRVERDLTAQVEACVPVVRRHLRLFQAQHPMETGRNFGALLEVFLTKEVETAFRNWRVCEDERIQKQLDGISSRFVAQANGVHISPVPAARSGAFLRRKEIAWKAQHRPHNRYIRLAAAGKDKRKITTAIWAIGPSSTD